MAMKDIDEVNAYRNEDGTFFVEINGIASAGRIKITLPRASLSLSVSGGIGHQAEMEVKLEGYIDKE